MNNALIYIVMEKVAIPIWDERVSPVLDTATRLMILEFNDGQEKKREMINIPQEHFIIRTKYIAGLKVDTVLCGALSKPMRRMLIQSGITVFPWVTGYVNDVIQAYLDGNLTNEQFLLPRRSRRRRKRGFRYNRYQNPTGNDFYQEDS